MASETPNPRVLVGPRRLKNRICRLMYAGETDEAWTEVWRKDSWQRTPLLVRDVLSAPPPQAATLARRGIPDERGEWDLGAQPA